jgi:hypothetical protein
MSRSVVVHWNGEDLPDQLRELPAGRYLIASLDEMDELSPEEDVGLNAALASVREGRTVSHEDVMASARKLLGS